MIKTDNSKVNIELLSENKRLRENLTSANIEIKYLERKLLVAGRSNAEIMEYVRELGGKS